MPRRTPFTGRQRSLRATRKKFPEEWAWWAASGWQMMVEDGEVGGLHLHSYKQGRGFTLWGATATPEEAATLEGIRRFLAVALYCHLHPIKSRRLFDAMGKVCTEQELVAFIRRQRRRINA